MSLLSVSRELASGASAWKWACRVVSTSNITLSGLQTVDGVSLDVGDRVLVAGQSTATQNGLYFARNTAWVRTDDADQPNDFQLGMAVRVIEGTSYAGTTWFLTSPTTGSVSIGSTSLTYSAAAPLAGALTLPGDISPASLSSDQNDYSPTGLSGATRLRLTSSTVVNITGLAGGADGRVVILKNVGSNAIILVHASSSSAEANRFALEGAANVVLGQNAYAILEYDATSTRWGCMGRGAGLTPQATHTSDGTLSIDTVNLLSGSVATMTLPDASIWRNRAIVVKKLNIVGAVSIARSGSDTIDGATSYSLTGAYGAATFIAAASGAVIYAFPGV